MVFFCFILVTRRTIRFILLFIFIPHLTHYKIWLFYFNQIQSQLRPSTFTNYNRNNKGERLLVSVSICFLLIKFRVFLLNLDCSVTNLKVDKKYFYYYFLNLCFIFSYGLTTQNLQTGLCVNVEAWSSKWHNPFLLFFFCFKTKNNIFRIVYFV